MTMGESPNQILARFANPASGTFIALGASNREQSRGVMRMLGKLAAAWLGSKAAGPNEGAKGAIEGYGLAWVAGKALPTIAVIAALGWGAKKLYDALGGKAPSYPSDATPASPSS
jgi:hypothetical protein